MISHLTLYLNSIILGVVEGITEFLPLSSTGHMIIVGNFLKFDGEFAQLFEIVIQLGAILAIVVLFRTKIFDSLKSLKPNGSGFKLWTSLMLAFLPVGVMGILFDKKIKLYMMNPLCVSLALLIGGIFMIFAENKYRENNKITSLEQVGYKQALIIGCFQCIAILWPGFSRSASTIIGGWIMGLSSVVAAEFSFFLAIPTMTIATVYELIKTKIVLSTPEILSLIIGFAVSFVVAIVVVAKFIEFLKEKPMKSFAVYRIVVGVLLLGMAFFKLI